MRHLVLVFLVCLMPGLMPSAVPAKSLAKIAAASGLSPDDFNQVMAAERNLTQTPQQGRTVSWSNPDSGARGSSKLVALRDNCAFMQHFVYTSPTAQPNELRTRWCKQGDGVWLRMP